MYDTLAAYDMTTKPLGEATIESVTRVSRHQLKRCCAHSCRAAVCRAIRRPDLLVMLSALHAPGADVQHAAGAQSQKMQCVKPSHRT